MGEEGGRERVGVARGLGRAQFLVLGKRRARGEGVEGEGCRKGRGVFQASGPALWLWAKCSTSVGGPGRS